MSEVSESAALESKKIETKAALAGIGGTILLLTLFFAALTLIQSFEHATSLFAERWYLILALAFGFGVQVALFYYARNFCKVHEMRASASVAASGGVSTTSMVACCAHHIADAPALLGFGGAALFFAEYQNFFILIGIVSNALGSLFMLKTMQGHSIYAEKSFLSSLFSKYSMEKAFKRAAVLGIAVLLIAGVVITKNRTSTAPLTALPENKTAIATTPPPATAQEKLVELASKSDDRNMVTVSIDPMPFKYGEEIMFAVALNTHTVNLDYDLVARSMLEDDNNIYKPIEWRGPKPGGHHMSGTLVFPPISKTAKIKLTIKGIGGADRIFEWEL